MKSHGEALKTKEYMSWRTMRQRCLNPKRATFYRYGGRGIEFCERWEKYENFLEDMGRAPSPKHTLDRVDNNKNYSKENCRWATKTEQMNNTSMNHWIETPHGKMTISQISAAAGIKRTTIRNRVFAGWPYERLISKP